MGRSEAKLEADYQAVLIPRIYRMFDGQFCMVLKNDSSYQTGIPDLSVFVDSKWAWLEVKAYEGAREQPNQPYFVAQADAVAFGAFIYPENEEEVLHDLQLALGPQRSSRLSRR